MFVVPTTEAASLAEEGTERAAGRGLFSDC